MSSPSPLPGPLGIGRCAVVGAGRLGSALVASIPHADGPYGRGFDANEHDVVLLAVPDREIAVAAAAITPREGLLVGHCSGLTPLTPLAPHEAFSLHPLMTVTGPETDFAGAAAAIAGTTPRALATAQRIASELGLEPTEIADADRAAYHAAASIASNFLVTLEDAAEQLLGTAGADRAMLVPLVEATVANWAKAGRDALTGPIARGDDATVEAQRAAVEERTPHLTTLFDALTRATKATLPQEAGR